jgi:hypothetical protein
MRLSNWNGKAGLVIANNAIYCPGNDFIVSGLSGVTITGNVIVPGTAPFPTGGFVVGRSLQQDFIDAATMDAYPAAGSALIDAGDAAFRTPTDFNGTPRTGAPEAGAYHYGASQNPGWRVGPGFKPFGGDTIAPSPPTEVRAE